MAIDARFDPCRGPTAATRGAEPAPRGSAELEPARQRLREGTAESPWDVLVIGAGVAGAVAAWCCAKRGLKTLLVERDRFPRSKVCGCCLNGRALQVLAGVGVSEKLRALGGNDLRQISIRFGRRQLQLPLPAGYAVSRRRLDQLLVEEAVDAGAAFWQEQSAWVEPYSAELPAQSRRARDGTSSAASLPAVRYVHLRGRGSEQRIAARVVLVCDGLGHPSLQQLPGFHDAPQPGARIGLGAVFPRTTSDFAAPSDTVHMLVTKQGYVGLVQIEQGEWNLAAAVDAQFLRAAKSPRSAVETILNECRFPIPGSLSAAEWKGTLPLTRRTAAVAAHRLLLVGDATGYVEPFSGEGMAWGATAASMVAPLAMAAVHDGWEARLVDQWQHQFAQVVQREQRACHWLTRALHRPRVLPLLFGVSRMFPGLARALIHRINRVPAAWETWK